MDLEVLMKRHEEALKDRLPLQTAAEAATKALGSPTSHAMMEHQHRIASEAIASLVKAPDVRNVIENLALNTSVVAANQFSEMFNESRIAFDSHIRNLVTEARGMAFSGFTENVFRHQEKRMQELVGQLVAPLRSPLEDFASLTRPAFEPELTPRYVPRFLPEPRATATEEFIRRLKEHVDSAEQEAEESGGKLVVKCKTPSGDEIFVNQVSLDDEHFIRVIGVDQFHQHREFTGHHSAIGIAIEVVTDLEDVQSEDDESVN